MTKFRAILIAGPTASGKSQLAIDIAEQIDGVVVNADSMQVYRELQVLTARPSDADMVLLEHRLYGTVSGATPYSAGRYASDAGQVIEELAETGRTPVFVGGTGLYFQALLRGLSPIPAIADSIRQHWRSEAVRLGAEALHHVLHSRDRVMAERLAPSDSQRIVRALEVLEGTGQSLSEWQKIPGVPVLREDDCYKIVLESPREEIYANCDMRLDAMLAQGLMDEVAALGALELDPALPIMRAVGVVPFLRHLSGELELLAAVMAAKTETRNYAKRQLTWLRRNMITWNAISAKEIESLAPEIFNNIK